MRLKKISIVNYKNIAEASLEFSPNVNCFVGANGMGKTNVLDAIYYLSFCRSASNPVDSACVRHGEQFFLVDALYDNDQGGEDAVSCGVKTGTPKRVRRNGKAVKRLSDHVGSVPLVMISPSDSLLVTGGSEERRRFMDMVVSQYDAAYLEALIRYDKALKQRNALLRQDAEPDWGVVAVLEEMMASSGELIFSKRREFVEAFVPVVTALYARLCNVDDEEVGLEYKSHGFRGPLLPQLQEFRMRERAVGYSLHGPHKDDLELLLNGYPVKREGSQGQTKTLFIALKLAQFQFLKERGEKRVPLLLLDDIFDKLDAGRVSRIVEYASGESLGQIFITDTNREHLDRILESTNRDYKLFNVSNGEVKDGTPQV